MYATEKENPQGTNLIIEEPGSRKQGEFCAVRGVEENVATRQCAEWNVDLLHVEQSIADVPHPAQNIEGRCHPVHFCIVMFYS